MMRSIKLRLLTFGLMWFALAPSFAATDGGTATAQFLRIGQGARPQAMGGAFSAVKGDIANSFWNPAGLAHLEMQELTFSHLEFLEDIKSEYMAYAYPLKKYRSTFSGSVNYLNLGDVERRNITGAKTGDASLSALAATLGYSARMMEALSFGANVKLIQQDLDVETGSGFAFDAGFLAILAPKVLHLGAAVSNVGPKLKTGTSKEDLPTTIRGGAALQAYPDKVLLAIDVEQPLDSDLKVRAGGEYLVSPLVALRLGYEQQPDAGGGLTAGIGINMHTDEESNTTFGGSRDISKWQAESSFWKLNTSIDYAYVDVQEFDDVHRISITIRF